MSFRGVGIIIAFITRTTGHVVRLSRKIFKQFPFKSKCQQNGLYLLCYKDSVQATAVKVTFSAQTFFANLFWHVLCNIADVVTAFLCWHICKSLFCVTVTAAYCIQKLAWLLLAPFTPSYAVAGWLRCILAGGKLA